MTKDSQEVCICMRVEDMPAEVRILNPDNNTGPCAECGAEIAFRPNVPASLTKVCFQCGSEMLKGHVEKGEEFDFKPQNAQEVKDRLGITDQELEAAGRLLFSKLVPGTRQ